MAVAEGILGLASAGLAPGSGKPYLKGLGWKAMALVPSSSGLPFISAKAHTSWGQRGARKMT